MSDAPGAAVLASGRWTPAERLRLSGILAVVAGMHVLGWTLYLGYSASLPAASSFAGAGTLAYALGVRHAFDADHIAAIDDTTRLMLLPGRRPVGVGFFFAMGHSSVVLLLALVVAFAAGAAGTQGEIDAFRSVGGAVSVVVAMSFLLLVAALNALVLRGILLLWRRMTRGELDAAEIDRQLLNRGLLNRLIGGRARTLIRSSWHMYPLGFLFGLGLETASEVTLLTLSASTAVAGGLPVLATLTLPLLFASGMSAFDTCDSLLMTRAYSWAYRSPARRLYYNMATTGMTVLVAGFVGTVYLAGILVDYAGAHALAPYAALSQRFQLLGYGIVAAFVLAWLAAAAVWRFGGLARRYGGAA
ncbi:MAG: HoxN/HupN/NixA family nickel/cobalt transporter [Actinomycetota bacterium]